MADKFAFTRVTADGQVRAGPGTLHTVTVCPTTATPTAGLMTFYDSLTEAGTIILATWVFAAGSAETFVLDVELNTGLFIGYDGTLTNASVTCTWLS